jgi:hypothetical protein
MVYLHCPEYLLDVDDHAETSPSLLCNASKAIQRDRLHGIIGVQRISALTAL